MRSSSLWFALVVIVGVVGGCAPASENDLIPPRVIGVEPSGAVISVDSKFHVLLSEPMNAKTVDGDPASETFSVGLILTEDASKTFLSDIDNPPLTESRVSQVIPCDVELQEDDTVIEVAPRGSLASSTAYTLVVASEVRDSHGNPIVDGAGNKAQFRWDVTTDAGPPSVLKTDLVTDAANLVVPNRKRIHVTFNTSVVHVSADTLIIEGSPAPTIESVTLDESRTVAEIVLGDGGDCERLAALTSYSLIATSDIEADNGQKLVEFKEDFETGPSCDVTGNDMPAAPESIAGETDATIRFETSKASTTEVRFGLAGGALDCLGLPCPVLGAAARNAIAGSVPPRFAHSVQLTGLTLGLAYDFVAFAEDDVGNVATRPGTFVTEAVPEVALNETMANPPNGAAEPANEYIELASFTDADIAIGGFILLVDGGDENGGDTCVLPTPLTLPGHGYLLLVGNTFDGEVYGGIDEASLVRSGASSFCASITNSTAQSFVLTDGAGRPVSSMTAYGDVPNLGDEGVSVERRAPDQPDVAASWCRSLAAVGPTPARENGVTINGCAQ